jgi:hypothetical protein
MTDPRIELDRLRRELKDTEAVLWPSYWDLAKVGCPFSALQQLDDAHHPSS